MMVMAVEMMMMMMIPMKSSVRVMTMAMISPLREGISPTDCSLPESFLSLSIVSVPEEAADHFLDHSPYP